MISRQKIVGIYDNLDIVSYTFGKNVTKGWVNIECPFCTDSSNHCGVNPDTLIFSCWVCGRSGPFVDLLMELSGLSFGACKDIISSSTVTFKERPLETIKGAFDSEDVEIKSNQNKSIVDKKLPKAFELVTYDTNFSLLDSYLERRNISIDTIVKHRCGICRAGEYMNRLVIPVYYQGKLVSYQAADLSGFAKLKYRSAPLAMGAVNNYLYGYDKIDKRMIVVEGVLDKWRTGDEAVASFTSAITEAQKKLIKEKGLEELYICFDCELMAYYKAKKEAEEFRAYMPVVEVIRLPFGKDPDELGRGKIYECILETREF